MSDNSSSSPEGRDYNSDAWSYSTPQVSSSLVALVGSETSVPLQATPFATRAPSSQTLALAASTSCRPPQSRVVKANIDRCGSELSEKDLVSLRTSDRANAPPPRLRSISLWP
ncbi:hypothetical protein LIER_21556 [Lithospermum erythrorhizon]|uniref:Uncharacterized protein n=1 Tax=Lithospermum erythrorhizon TaxID=34254 RepID=A0AAV3QQM1_LITER